jgi:hypothetical protein
MLVGLEMELKLLRETVKASFGLRLSAALTLSTSQSSDIVFCSICPLNLGKKL